MYTILNIYNGKINLKSELTKIIAINKQIICSLKSYIWHTRAHKNWAVVYRGFKSIYT